MMEAATSLPRTSAQAGLELPGGRKLQVLQDAAEHSESYPPLLAETRLSTYGSDCPRRTPSRKIHNLHVQEGASSNSALGVDCREVSSASHPNTPPAPGKDMQVGEAFRSRVQEDLEKACEPLRSGCVPGDALPPRRRCGQKIRRCIVPKGAHLRETSDDQGTSAQLCDRRAAPPDVQEVFAHKRHAEEPARTTRSTRALQGTVAAGSAEKADIAPSEPGSRYSLRPRTSRPCLAEPALNCKLRRPHGAALGCFDYHPYFQKGRDRSTASVPPQMLFGCQDAPMAGA